MSDDRVSVQVSAEASQFDAGMRTAATTAKASFDGIRVSAQQAAAALAAAGGDTRKITTEMLALGPAVARSTAAVADLKKGVDAATQSFRLNRIGLLEMQAAGVNAFQALAAGMDPFRVATMEGAQVVGALVQGASGITTFAATMLAAAGAAAVLTAGLGYIAYQAIATQHSIDSIAGSMLLAGRQAETTTASTKSWIDELRLSFNLSRGTARETAEAFARVNTLTDAQARALQTAAVAAAQVAKADVSDVVAEWTKAFDKGAKGAMELARSMRISTEEARKLLNAGDEAGALAVLVDSITERVRANGEAWARARALHDQWAAALAMDPLGVGGGLATGSMLPPAPSTTPTASGGIEPNFQTNLQRMIEEAAKAGITLGLGSGFRSAEEQARLFADAVAKYGSEAEARRHVAPPGHSQHERGLAMDMRDASGRPIAAGSAEDAWLAANAARFNLRRPMSYEPWHVEQEGARGAQTAEAVGAEAAREHTHRARMLALDDELNKSRGNAAAILETRQWMQEEIEKVEGKGSLAAIRAQNDVYEAARLLGEDRIKDRVAKLQQEQTLARGNYAEQIRLQQQIIALEKTTRDEGAIRSSEAKLVTLRQDALQHQKQITVQGAEQQKQIDDFYLQSFTRNMDRMVSQKQITVQQALGFDIQYTAQLHTQQRQRLVDLMAEDNRTEDEKRQLYMRLLALDAQYEARLSDAQRRIAEANKRAAEASAAAYRGFFDSVGSGVERYLEAALMKTATFKDATKQLLTSIGSSMLKLMGDLASQLAAKKLAGMLGKTLEPGAGLGGLLGNMAGEALGIGGAGGAGGSAAVGAASTVAAGQITALGAAASAAAIAMGGSATATEAQTVATVIDTSATETSTLATIGSTLAETAETAANWAAVAVETIKALLVFEQGGIVPSAAGGMVVGGGGTMAILHKREMVLPAHLSEGLQTMIETGGGMGGAGNFTYAPQLNGSAPFASRSQAEAFFRRHGGAMTDHLRNLARNGWRG